MSGVSGRGVGVDVAMTRVRQLGGTLEIRSEVGKGTTFLIRVPLTLAIVRALLADAGGERYAVPLAYVAETVEFDPRAVTALRSREALVVREQVIPTVHLRDLVGSRGRAAPARRPTVILEVGERRTALVVDALLGQQDIVVAAVRRPARHAAVRGRGDDPRRRRAGAGPRRRRTAVGRELMEDVRGLKELQLDALREVANIGAGHAATALSQMTNRTIMIAVPEVNVRPLEEVTDLVGRPDEVVAAVLMHMMGDLTGRTLVLFPEGSARTLCDILFRRSAGTTGEFGAMEQSGLKEAGNILASAYMNALSDFMGMMLVPSVPSLVDRPERGGAHHHLPQLRPRPRLRLLRRDVVPGGGRHRAAARPLPAPARHAVAAGHLRRHPPALIRCPVPCCRSAISPSCAPLPAGSIPPTPAPTTTSASSTIRRG